MSPTVLPSAERRGGLQGRHVLITFLAFFAAIFAVNGALLYFALKTHSGLVAVEPYRKGLAYNDRIAADATQSALGWKAEAALSSGGALTVAMADRDGKPVAGLKVTGLFGRPSTSKDERRLALIETAPGRYSADLGALSTGAWRIDIEALRPATDLAPDALYRARRRLWLTP
ncbi:MAG TPA: FixH family protein [Hyphomicrobiaceae bacterium]|nr:FixH family protein [Hyphomicrobiaceae bacterium]